jgi:hypothetical protein
MRITVAIENHYEEAEVIKTSLDLDVPEPDDLAHLEDWSYDYIYPHTGTGREEGDAGYFATITESDDVPAMLGKTFEFGL